MADQSEREPQTVGELIRFWRTQRRLTQMELALDASLSTKHLSFVETGRSRPSRQLLIHLTQHLDLPIAERNRLLLAGGFAPPYLEQPYDGEVMQPLRESLSRLLEAYEPNPTLIVDGLWNLIEANRAAALLWDGVDPELLDPPINMLRLGVHPGGLPKISSMTAACNAPLIQKLRRRSREDADPALGNLIEEVEAYLPDDPPAGQATQPVVSLNLRTPLGEVSLFTVIATLGAPLEVTAASLAIETFVPMDARSAARLGELGESRAENDARLAQTVIRKRGVTMSMTPPVPRVLLRSEESEGAVSIVETSPSAGAGPPLHRHDFDEAFYVIEGRLSFQVGDEVVEVGPGELAFVPRGTPHTFANLSDAPARQLIVCTPAGFERYFARLAAERQGVDPPDWALQPIPEVTRLGPTLAERLGGDR